VSDNPFYRLAPFVQEYIYTHGWTELRAVQIEACRVIFDTTAHLLLAAGTASGKTEAAFLPIVTLLHQSPSATVGALYVGPLKALINDQFIRLGDLLKEANIPVWHWHGDVSQSHKGKLLKNPSGILQITPESLESLLINRSAELVRLLGDVRFVIIDEVHVFMGSDRGRQVLCQLARLSRFIRTQPRRIGLSATLGDYALAEQWLRAGTPREVITPNVKGGQQKVRLAVEHFYVPDQSASRASESESRRAGEKVAPQEASYYKYVFEKSKSRKCLIFANNRSEAESVIASLRQLAQAEGLPDRYHVHHGSIAAPLREAAEQAMRDPGTPAITGATLTLELGIDIGQLDRVIQLSAPFSVSSFLQRLGRSGRRGGPSEMWLVCSEDEPSGRESLPEIIPWHLLQSIAIIQLYLEERWIEPVQQIKFPFSLLYHQTMSTLAAMGELSPAALAERVLTLPPFREISKEDFRDLLLHLIKIDHIQQMEERGVIIGLAGEQIVRNFRFYAVFPDIEEFTVRDESKEIGSIITPPPPGERFALAGRTWEVLEVDKRRKTVFAKRVQGKAIASWNGSGGNIHDRILERMKGVLFEDTEYDYLQANARERLREARSLARGAVLNDATLVPLGGNTYALLPWMGSIAYRTLDRVLRFVTHDPINIKCTGGLTPYYLTLQMDNGTVDDFYDHLHSLHKRGIQPEDLISSEEDLVVEKYDEFVPSNLLRKAFAWDHIDTSALSRLSFPRL
jgi:ATP-dependent Lhr-like helicase